ncbi:MAG: S8 family peptidase [bacterium]
MRVLVRWFLLVWVGLGGLSVGSAWSARLDTTELAQRLASQGGVRVIVELDSSSRSGVSNGVGAGVPRILPRNEVAILRTSFLSKVPALAATPRKDFQFLPLMAFEMTPKVLSQLSSVAGIKGIYEDIALRPTLAESGALMDTADAYAASVEGAGKVVAILDTGVQTSHPFLAGKLVDEACYSTTSAADSASTLCPNGVESSTTAGSGVNCSASLAGCDHGTHVAGIAVGQAASQPAFTGVGKGAQYMAIQVFSRFDDPAFCGSNSPCIASYISDQLAALERVYALRNTHSFASVNMSLGGGRYFNACDGLYPSYTDIIDSLKAAGIATVIASGNDDYVDSVGFPACISSAITVASSCDAAGSFCSGADTIASYSNMSSQVDLIAPGSAIVSSVLDGNYATKHGTSMAAPQVAGVWALMKQQFPNASVDEITSQLQTAGVVIPDQRSGGSVDFKKRVDLAGIFAADSDNDTVLDINDNCLYVPNTDQRNTNSAADSFGNICDPDLDQSNLVGFADATLLQGELFGTDADADFDGDGLVNFKDVAVMKAYWGLPPGP